MNGTDILDVAGEALFVIVKVSFPIMSVGMFFGILMSFVQAITQIQENSLSFVPKILAIFASLLMFSSFIGSTLKAFSDKILFMISAV